MFQTKFVQKIKTHVLCSTTFSWKSCHAWDNVEKYGRSWQATDDSIARCMQFEYWITKATDIQDIASPWQQRLHEHLSVLCLHKLPVLYTSPLCFFTFCTFTASLSSVVYTCLLWYICIHVFTNILDIKAWPFFVFLLVVQHTKFPRSTTSHSVDEG